MTYQEFKDWCNDRVCDGMWGVDTFFACKHIMDIMNATIFFQRKKIWKILEPEVMAGIVEPVNKRIKESLERVEKYYGSTNSES